MTKVTVLLPVYNSGKYLRESIESIIHQSYKDWELLIINEYGSNDGSLKIIKSFVKADRRVRFVQNDTKLGLAESLNKGMRLAQGKYIARMDADDIAHSTRLKKQVEYLEKNPSVCVCGSFQHHFGKNADWIHKPPETPTQCKTNLVFFCDLCHSTLMLRKDFFLDNQLFYDNRYFAEDFELWTRVLTLGGIANIPEVLGEYRWGEDNISVAKKQQLQDESGKIVAKVLKETLGLSVPESKIKYFNNWRNPFYEIIDIEKRHNSYLEFQQILRQIYNLNKQIKFFDDQCLLNTIGAKWKWARYGFPFNQLKEEKDIDLIFKFKPRYLFLTRLYYFWIRNKGVSCKIRKVYGKIYTWIARMR